MENSKRAQNFKFTSVKKFRSPYTQELILCLLLIHSLQSSEIVLLNGAIKDR